MQKKGEIGLETPKEGRNKKFFLIFGILILVIIIVALIFIFSLRGGRDSSNDTLNKMPDTSAQSQVGDNQNTGSPSASDSNSGAALSKENCGSLTQDMIQDFMQSASSNTILSCMSEKLKDCSPAKITFQAAQGGYDTTLESIPNKDICIINITEKDTGYVLACDYPKDALSRQYQELKSHGEEGSFAFSLNFALGMQAMNKPAGAVKIPIQDSVVSEISCTIKFRDKLNY